MLNKPFALIEGTSKTLAAFSGLALISALSVKPATAASFDWYFNGDGFGAANLNFDEGEVSPSFLESGRTGSFTAADLGASATFNYYLNVQGERFSATDFSGVNPESLSFNFDNGNLTGYSWTDIGENLGWNLTVTPENWFTSDPTYIAPIYAVTVTHVGPGPLLQVVPFLPPVSEPPAALEQTSTQPIPEGSSSAALLFLGGCLLLHRIVVSRD